ncbi:hypothetical protein KSF_042120 [Reticulibacter mediterranei]|uniref:Streptomyces killer toxin-like beta/gamma crystallin domain-containing protein n=1 Tax=Reticulibacter mediterranei TaxID=2778369 RepID=A0A8J3N0F6_9CHLR|nr:beta/gamma crystallin domain-containing protein [Reticulibacter mediterranei]GHO94164.1 hypothetical protein KSF_042120 [Reticulibacter mediterranei]
MRTQLLKWGAVVIVLFGTALFVAGASSSTAKAASLQEAPPPSGNCELTWKDGGGGNVPLDFTYVTDAALKGTLQGSDDKTGYNLLCTGVNASMCFLVPSNNDPHVANETTLYLSNLMQPSKWIYDQLNNAYTLNCKTTSGSSTTSGGSTVSLGSPSGDIYRVNGCPYTDSFTGMVESDDYFDLTTDNGGHVDCFAKAGTLLVTVYNVSKVCTGNNTGYVIGTSDNGATFVKKDFSDRNHCYDIDTIPVVRQITIN